MISQKEVLDITAKLGFPITGQTLRNYIRSGLVQGAYNVSGGIPGKGIQAIYPIETAIASAVAKDMLTKNGRKLTSKEIFLAQKISNAYSANSKNAFIDCVKNLGGNIVDNPFVALRYISFEYENKIYSVNRLSKILLEWNKKILEAKKRLDSI